MNLPLFFEQATSPLTRSNDGRLKFDIVRGEGDRFTIDTFYKVVLDDEETVLETRRRIIVDAYIAGYDLAMDALPTNVQGALLAEQDAAA